MRQKFALQMIGACVALLAAALGGYMVGTRDAHDAPPATVPASASRAAASDAAPGERKPLYWYDPMYPQHKFDKAGKSPFMDMQLVPRYAEEEAAGAVRIDPTLSQNLGMRTAVVERSAMGRDVSAVATVGFNEREVAIVQARTDGFVERVYARAPGDVIQAGAPLADMLVPEWAGAQAEYLAVKASADAELTAAARKRLLLLGMSEAQIARIDHSGQPRAVISIAAPIGGVIQELGVRAGMSVSAGMTLARINGLRTVWLEAAVPEAQTAMLQGGSAVTARFAAYPGEVFKGKIAAVLPEANVQTRTLRVRMEFANPHQRLKIGMFAQVNISGGTQETLVVPSEAVIRTGKRSLVFVSDQPGHYRPVEVEVGQEMDGKLTVLSGLEEGQQVVVSGQFLIDSEASFQGLTEHMAAGVETGGGPSDTGQVHQGNGTVTELSPGRVTLSHGPIATLQWESMTMPFKLPNQDAASGLKAGDSVTFSFRQRNGDFVIESIEKSGGRP